MGRLRNVVDRWERFGRAAFGVHRDRKPFAAVPAEDPPPSPFSGVAGILAGGSTVVAGVLTFLGIQGDALDRLLRTQPNAFLVFGAMMALGVTAGFVAQKVVIAGSVRAGWVIVGAVGALVAFHFVANSLREQATEVPFEEFAKVLIPAAAVAVVLLVLVGGLRLANNGGLLVLGGVLFAFGAYGLVRLAIDSKDVAATPQFDSPRIERQDDGLLHVIATVSAEGLDDCESLDVLVDDALVGSQYGGGDAKAVLDLDVLLPAPATRSASVTLRGEIAGRGCDDERPDRAVEIALPLLPRSDGPSIVADWSDPGLMTITASATDDAGPAMASVFAIGRSSTDCQVLTYAVVPVGDGGDLAATVPVVVPATVLEVEVRAGYADDLPELPPDRYACGDVPELGSSLLVLRRDAVPATG